MEQIRLIKEMREHDRNDGRANNTVRPRYMVWENVPGAFSSAGGKDFAAVLEETIGVVAESKPVLEVPDGGWPRWGAIADPDGQWSVAWRTTDTQHWGRTVRERDSGNVVEFGTPQRRRRIALVADFNGGTAADILFGDGSTFADFGGQTAPEILFERQGLRGDFAESGTAGEGAAAAAGTGVETANDGGTDYLTGWDCQEKRVFTPKGVAPTLSGSDGGGGRTGCGYVFCIQGNCIDRADTAGCNGKGWTTDVSYTLNTIDRHAVCEVTPINTMVATRHKQLGRGTGFGVGEPGDPAFTISAAHSHAIFCMATGQANAEVLTGQSPTLNCNHEQPIVFVYDARGNGDGETVPTLTGDHENRVTDYTALVLAFKYHQGAGARGLGEQEEVSPSLCADGGHPPAILLTYPDKVSHSLLAKGQLSHRADEDTLILSCAEDGTMLLDGQPCTVVRMEIHRLTPLECERLQGYPDGWTDIGPWVDSKGKLHKESSDSARYKALGNSIALPFWKWLLKRISAQYERDATMASLFDGIGGFPRVWEQINGKGSCLWASEIDEFPMAVTKYHFGEE